VGGIVVQVVPEAAVPPCLVLAKVAAELAPAAGDVNGQELRAATRDDLLDQARGKVADVDHDRDGGVGPHAGGQRGQGPVRIQDAPSSHRYQVGRTVGPLVVTRAVSGWARKASTSKGGGCVTGSFPDPSRPVASRIAGGHHLARRTRVRSRSNLARSYSWRYRSGDPAAGRCRAAHPPEQATSGSWPEELRTWYALADGTQRTPAG
jgi:hypothetical protein